MEIQFILGLVYIIVLFIGLILSGFYCKYTDNYGDLVTILFVCFLWPLFTIISLGGFILYLPFLIGIGIAKFIKHIIHIIQTVEIDFQSDYYKIDFGITFEYGLSTYYLSIGFLFWMVLITKDA